MESGHSFTYGVFLWWWDNNPRRTSPLVTVTLTLPLLPSPFLVSCIVTSTLRLVTASVALPLVCQMFFVFGRPRGVLLFSTSDLYLKIASSVLYQRPWRFIASIRPWRTSQPR